MYVPSPRPRGQTRLGRLQRQSQDRMECRRGTGSTYYGLQPIMNTRFTICTTHGDLKILMLRVALVTQSHHLLKPASSRNYSSIKTLSSPRNRSNSNRTGMPHVISGVQELTSVTTLSFAN